MLYDSCLILSQWIQAIRHNSVLKCVIYIFYALRPLLQCHIGTIKAGHLERSMKCKILLKTSLSWEQRHVA